MARTGKYAEPTSAEWTSDIVKRFVGLTIDQLIDELLLTKFTGIYDDHMLYFHDFMLSRPHYYGPECIEVRIIIFTNKATYDYNRHDLFVIEICQYSDGKYECIVKYKGKNTGDSLLDHTLGSVLFPRSKRANN